MQYLREIETDQGTTIQVYELGKKFAVRLFDYDANKTVGVRIFDTLESAYIFADKIYSRS